MNEIPYMNGYWVARKTGTGTDGTPEWEQFPGSLLPLGTADYLDERLDEAYITVKRSEIAFFKPTTEIRIEIEQRPNGGAYLETTYLYYVIASDDAQDCPINYGGDKRFYRHELYLVEITKLMEGIVAEAATYTNTSGTAYAESDWVVTGQGAEHPR